MPSSINRHIRSALLLLVSTAVLMSVALYNGYAIVDTDTAAYLEQAAYPHFTPERTPFYGLFVRMASMRYSLWPVVALQSMAVAWLLLQLIRYIAGTVSAYVQLAAVVAITAFTPIGFVAATLLPDVFGATLALSLCLLLLDNSASRLHSLLYTGIALVSMLMHFQFMVLGIVAVIAALVYHRKQHLPGMRMRAIAIAGICALFWLVMSGANAMKHHGFVFARGGAVMFVARQSENGILNNYLQHECKSDPSPLCAYTNHVPTDMRDFLESGVSPLYQLGGWDSSEAVYGHLTWKILTTPTYAGQWLMKSVTGTLKQAVRVLPPSPMPAYGKQSEVYKKISAYYAPESRAYITSMQQAGKLQPDSQDLLYLLLLIITGIWLILRHESVFTRATKRMYLLVLALMIANAWVCGTFATIAPLLQYRIAWLLPAMHLLLLLKTYLPRLTIDYHRSHA